MDAREDRLIDIREPFEWSEKGAVSQLERQPLSSFDSESLNPQERTVLVCQKGIRSKRMAQKLRREGFSKVFSLIGGVKDFYPRDYR